jgi:hypothetical protein
MPVATIHEISSDLSRLILRASESPYVLSLKEYKMNLGKISVSPKLSKGKGDIREICKRKVSSLRFVQAAIK